VPNYIKRYTPEVYPNVGLGDHNYCRNPDGRKRIWCGIIDPKLSWEECDTLINVGAGININPLYSLITSKFTDIDEGWLPSNSNFKFTSHILGQKYGDIMFCELRQETKKKAEVCATNCIQKYLLKAGCYLFPTYLDYSIEGEEVIVT
jgi:hypothetical protein